MFIFHAHRIAPFLQYERNFIPATFKAKTTLSKAKTTLSRPNIHYPGLNHIIQSQNHIIQCQEHIFMPEAHHPGQNLIIQSQEHATLELWLRDIRDQSIKDPARNWFIGEGYCSRI